MKRAAGIPFSLTPDSSQVYRTQRRSETVSTDSPNAKKTVETVFFSPAPLFTPLKRGVNERRRV